MKIKYLSFLITVFALGGCSYLKDMHNDDRIKIDKENLSQLNGLYHNVTDSLPEYKNSLWYQIDFWNSPYLEHTENTFVQIEVKNNKKLSAKLFSDNKIIKEMIIHGKIKDGYFYKRRVFFVIPFFPLIFGYINDRTRIGVANRSLIIDKSKHRFGFVIMAGGIDSKVGSRRYDKKK